MSNFKQKQEDQLLEEIAEILTVENNKSNEARYQLDKNIHQAEKLEDVFSSVLNVQDKLLDSLKYPQQNTENAMDILLDDIDEILQMSDVGEVGSMLKVTDISDNWETNVKNNRKYAKEQGIDLSHPFQNMFSDVERGYVNQQLIEKFELCRLVKEDYAFASASGLITGIIDVCLVGTISANQNTSKLQQAVDKCFDKIVIAYAHMEKTSLLKGQQRQALAGNPSNAAEIKQKFAKLISQSKQMDKKQSISFLEKTHRVGYDMAIGTGDLSGINPSNHHLFSLAHMPSLLGLLVGILDQLTGKSTFIEPGTGKIIRKISENKQKELSGNPVVKIAQAIHNWFGHIMSDIAGSNGSAGRGAGLPVPGWEALQKLSFGQIPIKNNIMNVAEMSEWMYKNGYDVRSFTAQVIPVLINEILVRMYWFIKQHYYYGKSFEESILSTKENRELSRLLLTATAAFSTVDVTHAAITGKGDIGTFIMTVNIPGLADFAFRCIQNIRYEIKHRKHVEKVLDEDIQMEWKRILQT